MVRAIHAVSVAAILLGLMMAPSVVGQSQPLPSISLTCDEGDAIDVFEGALPSTMINCQLENPSIYTEKVVVSLGSEDDDLALPAVPDQEVEPGGTVSFAFRVEVPFGKLPGWSDVNVTAKVTEANNVQVGLLTSEEEEVVTVEVNAFHNCIGQLGQGGGTIDAGDPIMFSATINCNSNVDYEARYSIGVVGGLNSVPSGFESQGEDCVAFSPPGGKTTSCVFQISTPSNLENKWEGCLFLFQSYEEVSNGVGTILEVQENECRDWYMIQVVVEPTGLSLQTLGLGENTTVADLIVDNKEIVGGGIGALILLVSLIVIVKRRPGPYDDDWEED